MSAKKWSFSYKRGQNLELKQHILDTLSLWVAIGLLWYSFLSIIKEYFPEFLKVTEVVDNLGLNAADFVEPSQFATYEMDWLMILILILVLWIGYEWPSKYLKKGSLIFKIAGVCLPGVYFLLNFDKVVDGFIRLAWFYLPYWNSYYKMNLHLGIAMSNANSVVAFTALSMLLWALVWTIAYAVKKRVLLVFFPVIALGIELLVGLSPTGNALYVAFFAAILLMTLGGVSVVKKIVAIACVAGSILLTGVAFDSDIKELATPEKKQEILQWQKEFKWSDINLLNLLQIDFHFNREQLNNNEPQYNGKTVLEIETSVQPLRMVYLKGFYGTKYENGNWTYDDSAFRAACKEAGISTEEASLMVFQMPYEHMMDYFEGSAKDFEITYTIHYTGSAGDVGYAPYLTDFNSSKKDYTLMGDYLLKRSIWDGSTTISGFNGGVSYYSINEAIEYGFGNIKYDVYSSYLPSKINLSSQKEQLDFLNGLANAYLTVPDTDGYLMNAGNVIEESMMLLGGDTDGLLGVGQKSVNAYRLDYASAVASYLASHMSYSLKLDTLPWNADPIEYALTESHEGYCMHFASAATLLLRQAGIPARYVSGYAVESNAFVKDMETGTYKAKVGDFMAHAWVEVYLDNIGWVDIEVTPGSSLENLPTQDDINRWEYISQANRDKYNPPEESESEDTQEVQDTQDTEDKQNPSQNTESQESQTQQENTQSESETDKTQNPGGNGSQGGQAINNQTWKVLGLIGIVTTIVLVILMGAKYGLDYYEELLQEEVNAQKTRRAVKRINRRMYRTLRLRNPRLWLFGKLSDVAYEKALIECYAEIPAEDWKQFMDIVKRNHYSHETISVEEMLYVYECYKKVKIFTMKGKE